ncbi:MAG: pyridoxamine 5'-phosphate oxidase family protein [Patescibacteria group bacterium]|nr:pyridoxamine 5'-phosphate oxidase family protein [Patescibacteria group bacterium]
MEIAEKKRKVLRFLKQHHMGVIATLGGSQPEAAAIDFSETAELEVVFTTLAFYRKYKNLRKNSRVAFVVGGEEKITLQYEGVAEELSVKAFAKYLKRHVQKNPVEKKFAAMPEARFFKVRPVWLRYSDFAAQPNNIFEINF